MHVAGPNRCEMENEPQCGAVQDKQRSRMRISPIGMARRHGSCRATPGPILCRSGVDPGSMRGRPGAYLVAKSGRVWPKLGQFLPACGQARPEVAELGLKLFSPTSFSTTVGQLFGNFGTTSGLLSGRFWVAEVFLPQPPPSKCKSRLLVSALAPLPGACPSDDVIADCP